jgi:phage-related protein
MPEVEIRFFKEDNGSAPCYEWLQSLSEKEQDRCQAALERLEEYGRDLRRPHTENLGNGIWELRIRIGNLRYRILYFFHGRKAVVLSHGITKKSGVIPPAEIERAKWRKERFEKDPEGRTWGVPSQLE